MYRSLKTTAAVLAVLGGLLAGGAGPASADASADGTAIGSPGLLSGNVVEVPINLPVLVCGNSIDLLAALNPAIGNTCTNND